MTHEILREKYNIYYDTDWHVVNKKTGYENKIFHSTTKHKYGEDKIYAIVATCGKAQSLGRVLWTYFNGDIPKGYDVDHINDNSLDNRLENLQLLTRKENLKKRGHSINQYTVGLSKEEREELWNKSRSNLKN